MRRAPSLVRLRALSLLVLSAIVALALWRLAATSAAELSRRMLTDGPLILAKLPFDEALIGICSVALVACGAWMVLVTALLVTQVVVQATVVEQVTGRTCPRLAQRFVLTACGVALTTGLASPATADPVGTAGPPTAAPQVGLVGLVIPDRTVGPHSRHPRQSQPARITVTAGASLWSIAKSVLPTQADDAEITAAWHAVQRANPHRIGNDPDLIFPGVTLQIPDLDAPNRKDHP